LVNKFDFDMDPDPDLERHEKSDPGQYRYPIKLFRIRYTDYNLNTAIDEFYENIELRQMETGRS